MPQLAVDRMTTAQLHRRLRVLAQRLDPSQPAIGRNERLDRMGAWRELKRVAAELELRGTQGRLEMYP